MKKYYKITLILTILFAHALNGNAQVSTGTEKVENYSENHKNGVLWRKGKVIRKAGSSKPIVTGIWKYYTEQGELEKTGNWNNGSKEGEWKEYSNGSLIKKSTYKNNKKNGEELNYDEFGKLSKRSHFIDDEKTGAFELYDNERLKFSGNYINGKEEGELKCYNEDGIGIHKIMNYKNGKFIDQMVGTSPNNKRNGEWIYAREDVGIISTSTYKDDVKVGIEKTYWPDDFVYITKSKGNYVNGKKDGRWKYFNEEEKLCFISSFKDGVEDKSKIYVFDEKLTANLGHSGSISDFVFSPNDNNTIISASDDHTLKVWDIQTARVIRSFSGNETPFMRITISPDSKTIATADYDGIKIWDQMTGYLIKTIKTKFIYNLLYSADGKYIISKEGNIIHVRNSSTGEEISQYDFDDYGGGFVLSKDGKNIIAFINEDIKLINIKTGNCEKTVIGNEGEINCIKLNSQGSFFATGHENGKIIIWDANTFTKVLSIKGHSKRVLSVDYSPDGETIISGSEDEAIKFWNIHNGKEVNTINTGSKVRGIKYSPDGITIASRSTYPNYNIKLWDASTGAAIKTLESRIDPIVTLAYSADGKTIFSNNKIWKSQMVQNSYPNGKYNGIIRNNPFSEIIAVLDKGNVLLINKSTNQELRTLKGNTEVYQIEFSPDGTILATRDRNTIALWEVQTGKKIIEIEKWNIVTSYSNANNLIAVASPGSIQIWNLKTKQNTLTIPSAHLKSLAYSPDGNTIASDSKDNKLKLWDSKNGKELQSKSFKYGDNINSLCYSPNGKIIASAHEANIIKLWDSKSLDEIKTLKGHSGAVSKIVFSPDGKRIISGSDDGTSKIWDVETGKLLITLIEIKNTEDWMVYCPDGRYDGSEKGIELMYIVYGFEVKELSGSENFKHIPNLLGEFL